MSFHNRRNIEGIQIEWWRRKSEISMRGQLHYLELVYPPITNQEAEWVKDDPLVQEAIAKSSLYFIGQKPETFYEFDGTALQGVEQEGKIHFTYVSGTKRDKGYIDIPTLLDARHLSEYTTIEIELGEKLIRLWMTKDHQRLDIIDWFTTDKILYDKSRQKTLYLWIG